MRRPVLVLALATLIAMPAVAADRVAFDSASAKQLAGPPAEMAAMRAPAPTASAVYSHSALLNLELAPVAGSAMTRWQGEIPVDRERVRVLVFAGAADLAARELRPASVRGLARASLVQPPVETSFGMGEAQVPARAYEFDGFMGDRLALTFEARDGASRGVVLIEGNRNTELVSWPLSTAQRVGDRYALAATLAAGDSVTDEVAMGERAGRIEQAVLRVTDPDGAVSERPMRQDAERADGSFVADFELARAGDYTAQVEVRGRDAQGRAFVRTSEHLVPAVARSLEITARQAAARRVADTRVMLRVPVAERAGGPDHYRAFGEVWGRGADGAARPVAWVGGMVAVQDGAIELGFDERWIDLAGARAPFELRDLRVEDPDRSIAVATSLRMPLVMPRRNVLFDAGQVEVDESMLMGPRPGGMMINGVGKRLLLVHGYCSGGVWPAAQFATSSTFLDKNQNRSNDQFAQRLKNFGATWNSFGTVAHSQGGMAALHLYTYYWSGLDNATGSRLMQSVGTPYQGTNLAGILAALGNWFGVGCGKQNDLTYSGASAWLAGIPTWARQKVNYYTTAFKTTNWYTNDYCNMATDLVLSDPEDGTTEKAYGQLPNAINRGHVAGQCHTSGMRDPAQYLDSSRNATMNANAAR